MELFVLAMFVFGVIGMTHIVVDSAIMQPIRNFLKEQLPAKMYSVFECYQCSGFWCGIFISYCLFNYGFINGGMFIPPFWALVFIGGCAGSFLANWGAVYLNYLEAQTLIKLDDTDENKTN